MSGKETNQRNVMSGQGSSNVIKKDKKSSKSEKKRSKKEDSSKSRKRKINSEECKITACVQTIEKSTQTDAAVLLDSSLPNHKVSDEGDLEEVHRTKLMGNENRQSGVVKEPLHDSDRNCKVSPSPPSDNVLPGLNRCLQGACLVHKSVEGAEDPVWLGCSYKEPVSGRQCNYWIHAKCHGFPHMSYKAARIAKGFRCPRHLE